MCLLPRLRAVSLLFSGIIEAIGCKAGARALYLFSLCAVFLGIRDGIPLTDLEGELCKLWMSDTGDMYATRDED